MAFCEQCGAQIVDDSVFCEQCGTRQSAIARQIPAVEVNPREESAEETPLPEQPVGGNRSIRLCPDGKYRWFYEFSMRWQTCTALRKTSGIFCTSCFPRKCAPACLPCAVGLPLRTANYAGRCRVTPIYPATSGKWTPSAMPAIAAQTFLCRRVHPSWLPTAVRCWSAAGTTATAIRSEERRVGKEC